MQGHHHIHEFRKIMNENKSRGYKRKRLNLNTSDSVQNETIDLLG